MLGKGWPRAGSLEQVSVCSTGDEKEILLNIYVLYVLHLPTEPAFTSMSDATVATKPAIVPGSWLVPSKPPSAGTTGVVRDEPSQVPSQTTANAMEHTPAASPEKPGQHWLCKLQERAAVSLLGIAPLIPNKDILVTLRTGSLPLPQPPCSGLYSLCSSLTPSSCKRESVSQM